jgi:hypothetical protein
LDEREFQNMSYAHIKWLDGGIKPPVSKRKYPMITLLIGLLASTIYAWWHRRQGVPKA